MVLLMIPLLLVRAETIWCPLGPPVLIAIVRLAVKTMLLYIVKVIASVITRRSRTIWDAVNLRSSPEGLRRVNRHFQARLKSM